MGASLITEDSPASLVAPAGEVNSPAALSIGIVIPVFNEATILAQSLSRLREIIGDEEVVVVDGGSSDRSAQIASRFFRAEAGPPANRGAQLSWGSRFLKADVLIFLHTDSQLPAGFQASIRSALREPEVVGGCFQLEFDVARPMLRFYSWCTQFPGRFLHFGDQAFFVRREVFEEMEGFRALPFLEDVDFLRRLRRRGRFVVLSARVVTASRRFMRHGIVRQMLRNIVLVTLFELGISPERLARFYPPTR
jgi:rSAM/selenodomain-associated transferase 2